MHSNEGDVRSSLDSSPGVVLTAPVVGMPFYNSLAAAAVGCVYGSTCDTILDLFVKYFQDAVAAIGEQLSDYVKKELVEGAVKAVLQPAKALQQAVQELPERVETDLGSCRGTSEAAVEAKEAATRAIAKLKKSLGTLDTFVKDAEELYEVRE